MVQKTINFKSSLVLAFATSFFGAQVHAEALVDGKTILYTEHAFAGISLPESPRTYSGVRVQLQSKAGPRNTLIIAGASVESYAVTSGGPPRIQNSKNKNVEFLAKLSKEEAEILYSLANSKSLSPSPNRDQYVDLNPSAPKANGIENTDYYGRRGPAPTQTLLLGFQGKDGHLRALRGDQAGKSADGVDQLLGALRSLDDMSAARNKVKFILMPPPTGPK